MKTALACLGALTLSGSVLAGVGAGRAEITGLAVTPDGKALLVAGMDGRLRLVDLASRKQQGAVRAHKGGVWDLALSADGKRFISGGADRVARVWDRASLREIRAYEGHGKEVSAVALSPDGKRAASGDYAGLVHVWEVATGKERFARRGSALRMTSLAFSPDGRRLAGGGIEAAEIGGFRGSTRSSRLRLWDSGDGAEQTLPETGARVAFTPTGRELVAAGHHLNFVPVKGGISLDGGSRTVVWDLDKRRRRLALNEYWGGLALSPDGRYIATSWGSRRHLGGLVIRQSEAKGAHLWEAVTGKQVWARAVKQTDAVIMTFTPDGQTLIVGTKAGTWDYLELRPANWKAPAGWKAGDYDRAWQALGETDGAKAYATVWDLSSRGDEAVSWLQQKLKPAGALPAGVKNLLADLDSDDYDRRKKARHELEKLGEEVEPALREANRKPPSLEVKRALAALLARLDRTGPSPQRLRAGRALTVLERVGSKAARSLLDGLGKGAEGAFLTEQARLARARLGAR